MGGTAKIAVLLMILHRVTKGFERYTSLHVAFFKKILPLIVFREPSVAFRGHAGKESFRGELPGTFRELP